jgi:hypothetical protein
VGEYGVKSKIVYNSKYQCHQLLVCGFSLDIGNNYTLDHLFDFLFSQKPEIIDLIEKADTTLGDIITLCYRGNYGKHKELISVSDASDYLRHYNKIYYP